MKQQWNFTLLDSDDSEFLDTYISSNTDFGAQEYDAFLLDVGDKNGVGDDAYVTNFLWEDVSNYIRQREI